MATASATPAATPASTTPAAAGSSTKPAAAPSDGIVASALSGGLNLSTSSGAAAIAAANAKPIKDMTTEEVIKAAEAAVQTKEYDRGITLWEEAQRRSPNATDIKISLAFALERMERVGEALVVCQEALKLAKTQRHRPKMSGMLLAEARCHSKLGQKKVAIERLNEALAESPNYRSGLSLKAIIAQEISDSKSEMEALIPLSKLGPSSNIHYRLATLFAGADRIADAHREIERAIALAAGGSVQQLKQFRDSLPPIGKDKSSSDSSKGSSSSSSRRHSSGTSSSRRSRSRSRDRSPPRSSRKRSRSPRGSPRSSRRSSRSRSRTRDSGRRSRSRDRRSRSHDDHRSSKHSSSRRSRTPERDRRSGPSSSSSAAAAAGGGASGSGSTAADIPSDRQMSEMTTAQLVALTRQFQATDRHPDSILIDTWLINAPRQPVRLTIFSYLSRSFSWEKMGRLDKATGDLDAALTLMPRMENESERKLTRRRVDLARARIVAKEKRPFEALDLVNKILEGDEYLPALKLRATLYNTTSQFEHERADGKRIRELNAGATPRNAAENAAHKAATAAAAKPDESKTASAATIATGASASRMDIKSSHNGIPATSAAVRTPTRSYSGQPPAISAVSPKPVSTAAHAFLNSIQLPPQVPAAPIHHHAPVPAPIPAQIPVSVPLAVVPAPAKLASITGQTKKGFAGWNPLQLGDWFASHGEPYKAYVQPIVDNCLDGDTLQSFVAEGEVALAKTMTDLGISNAIHRRVLVTRILAAAQ